VVGADKKVRVWCPSTASLSELAKTNAKTKNFARMRGAVSRS
jgi:hypothetical protein